MTFVSWLSQSGLGVWVRESRSIWAYPTILTLHTVGLALLAGLSIAVDLRMLGVARRAPLAPMAAFFPVMWLGFWINAVTGVALFATDAERKIINPAFRLKMLLVFVSIVILRVIQRKVFSGATPARATPSAVVKVLACASLACWLGAIVAGRLIAYWEVG